MILKICQATALLAGLLLLPACVEPPAPAGQSVVRLAPIAASASTGKKPQSKLWTHDGRWWAVLPSENVVPAGTWLWRLEPDNSWKHLLRLSSSTTAKADTRQIGDVTHILLHDDIAELVSLEYLPSEKSYRRWSERPRNTPLPLPDSETASIDIDTTGRLWLATESGSSIQVYYSDSPYYLFKGPVTLANDIARGDIGVVTALPGAVAVLWSNQNRRLFGFRLHPDGAGPTDWLPDEIPAAQSALPFGGGMADDHLNVAVATDGTLYAAVKTSYDAADHPRIALLVRRPRPESYGGDWDDLYEVDQSGTRGIVLINEPAGRLDVVYTSRDGPHEIVCRQSPLSGIRFGPRVMLMQGALNNASSTKQRWTDNFVVLASGALGVEGVRVTLNREEIEATSPSSGRERPRRPQERRAAARAGPPPP